MPHVCAGEIGDPALIARIETARARLFALLDLSDLLTVNHTA